MAFFHCYWLKLCKQFSRNVEWCTGCNIQVDIYFFLCLLQWCILFENLFDFRNLWFVLWLLVWLLGVDIVKIWLRSGRKLLLLSRSVFIGILDDNPTTTFSHQWCQNIFLCTFGVLFHVGRLFSKTYFKCPQFFSLTDSHSFNNSIFEIIFVCNMNAVVGSCVASSIIIYLYLWFPFRIL